MITHRGCGSPLNELTLEKAIRRVGVYKSQLLVKRIQPEFPKLQEEGGRATFNQISGGDQGLKLCAIVRSTYIVHRA